mgnify:CR=1 FL=1
MSIFLTDPDDLERPGRKRYVKAANGYTTFKEDVCDSLQHQGIELRPAETAVIDFRSQLMGYFQEKVTPTQAATMMVDDVRRIYRTRK